MAVLSDSAASWLGELGHRSARVIKHATGIFADHADSSVLRVPRVCGSVVGHSCKSRVWSGLVLIVGCSESPRSVPPSDGVRSAGALGPRIAGSQKCLCVSMPKQTGAIVYFERRSSVIVGRALMINRCPFVQGLVDT